ncbi:MAG: hypothetical protein EA397_11270 [Deltaproteobacteria bacterium]|nr:MAG: hypothetical protein EA397_11270 [Deltaproteobacteria bacterium]
MPVLKPDPQAEALLQPLSTVLAAGLDSLPNAPDARVRVSKTDGFFRIDLGDLPVIVLSEALLGPDMLHPAEAGRPFALDRWRRAVSALLEGLALLTLERDLGAPLDPADWRVAGLAGLAADLACPDLQLALPDLVRAAAAPRPGSEPRAGVAVYRAAYALGEDPWALAKAWLSGPGPTVEDWLRYGRWVLGAGLPAHVGVAVDPAPLVDIPVDLPAWSWARLEVPAHPRGGRILVSGGAVVADPWAPGGQVHRTLAGALAEPGALRPDVGGPVGSWDCVSARGFGQVFGVRGMTFSFHASGRMELVLADAFAGGLDALEAAEEVGTSGHAPGTWKVEGERFMRFFGLELSGLSMHGRKNRNFVVPAGPMGLGQILQAMQATPWRWEVREQDLYLSGDLMGGRVELRMRPSA